tara:strand:- start:534 stop:653 length:120 start_codon:yes stop_codon:yes gene_type:complete
MELPSLAEVTDAEAVPLPPRLFFDGADRVKTITQMGKAS